MQMTIDVFSMRNSNLRICKYLWMNKFIFHSGQALQFSHLLVIFKSPPVTQTRQSSIMCIENQCNILKIYKNTCTQTFAEPLTGRAAKPLPSYHDDRGVAY